MRTPVVVLPALTGKQALAWDALMAVAADLGEGWTLIGGQMVERAVTVSAPDPVPG